MKIHRKIKHNERCAMPMIKVPKPKVKVAIRSEVKTLTQQ